jgi:hypothetical protein
VRSKRCSSGHSAIAITPAHASEGRKSRIVQSASTVSAVTSTADAMRCTRARPSSPMVPWS